MASDAPVHEAPAAALLEFPGDRMAMAPFVLDDAPEATPVAVAQVQDVAAVTPEVAMTLETVVLAETPSLLRLPPQQDLSGAPALHETIAEAAISSIEEDIASILQTLERQDSEAAAAADDGEGWLDAEDDEAGEEPMSALLSELNRLWVSDPDIRAQRAF